MITKPVFARMKKLTLSSQFPLFSFKCKAKKPRAHLSRFGNARANVNIFDLDPNLKRTHNFDFIAVRLRLCI